MKMSIGKTVPILLLVCLCVVSFSAPAFAKAKKGAKAVKSVRKKAPVARSQVKEEAEIQVPQSVIDALSSGDLNGSIIAMREVPQSPKLLYLTREVARITSFEMKPKVKEANAHKILQNVGIAYHNLYLFLKTRGVFQKDFFEKAMNSYKKARGRGTSLHKADCDVLMAALYASSGDIEKGKKIFSKIDETSMRSDFESAEYLAAYHAAAGNIDSALLALEAAHRINPDAILTWLAVGDDFANIATDPAYQSLLVSWKAIEATKRLSLTVPKTASPRLDVHDETGIFRPQKTMPHYDLKAAKKHAKTKAYVKKKGKAKKASKPVKKKTHKK